MTSSSIPANPLGEHHRHAAVKTAARHLKPKHPVPRHVTPVVRRRPRGGALVAAAAAVAVFATVAMWAPTLGASRSVALDSGTSQNPGGAQNQGGAAAGQVPTPAPATVSDVPTTGSSALATTWAEFAAARTFAGSQLASNAGLTLSAAARELLVGGQVDARGILSLGQYLGQTQLTVADFPATGDGAGAGEVRRQILVSGQAGVPLGTDAAASGGAASGSAASGSAAPGGAPTSSTASDAAAASVEAWFQALSAPVNAESVVRTPAGVLVTFAPGEPSALLPSPAPSR